MKKLFLFMLIVLFSASFTQAQKFNRGFSDIVDTLESADTLLFPYAGKIVKHTGIISFSFTMVNITDSCNVIRIEGSDNNSNWHTVSTLAATNVTSSRLSEDTPDYLYYRLFTSTAASDTVSWTAVNFIYKED